MLYCHVMQRKLSMKIVCKQILSRTWVTGEYEWRSKGIGRSEPPFSDMICRLAYELPVTFVSLVQKHVWPPLVFHPLFSASSLTPGAESSLMSSRLGHRGSEGSSRWGQIHFVRLVPYNKPFTYSSTTASTMDILSSSEASFITRYLSYLSLPVTLYHVIPEGCWCFVQHW